MTDEALRLDEDGFETRVGQFVEAGCLGLPRAVSPGGIGIYPAGEPEELGPEEVEVEKEW